MSLSLLPKELIRVILWYIPCDGRNWLNVLLLSKQFLDIGSEVFEKRQSEIPLKIFVLGGYSETSVSPPNPIPSLTNAKDLRRAIQVYNVKRNQWTKLSSMPDDLLNQKCFTKNEYIYMLGGERRADTGHLKATKRFLQFFFVISIFRSMDQFTSYEY